MKAKFLVTVSIPDGVSHRDMADYIRDAVKTWREQLHPDEPLFNLNPKSVTVTNATHKLIFFLG